MRALFGCRSKLVAIATLAIGAGSATMVTPALARDILKPGTQIGTFKVLSGQVQQSVDYLDSFKVTPQMQNDCWTYLFKDQGAARFKLSFGGEQTALVTAPGGLVQFKNPLRVSGTGSRKWSTAVDNTPGPNADSSDCGKVPANPPHASTAGCGTKSVKGVKSAIGLALAGPGGIRFSGASLDLFGAFFSRKDPFEPCPSDSSYGVFVAQAWSRGGAKKLDEAKIGTTVKLSGELTQRPFGPETFLTPYWGGEFVSGSQVVHVAWSLTLQRVKPGAGRRPRGHPQTPRRH